jgi:uncharacterized Zn finger protein
MPPRRPRDGQRRDWDGNWPPPSTPIPVEGGLQARSQRGRIGDTWWSQRFIAVLESFGLGSRLQRGKRYARTGQVLHLEIGAGRVTASVQGSRAKPYRVFIETGVLSAAEWDAVESVMVTRAVFLATLLAGDMPEEIEEAFTGASCPLFPASSDELVSACSCPDWENPCKHIAAVYFLLAEAFDDDPFLILAWRGRNKAELLAGLRARRHGARAGDTASPESAASSETPDTVRFGWPTAVPEPLEAPPPAGGVSFWGRPEDVLAVEIRPRLAVAPDLVLRQLDPQPLGAVGSRIVEGLRLLYEAITAGAAAEALGEPAPASAVRDPGGHDRRS